VASKGGFGLHPLGAWLDRGDGTGEALSGVLRPGNAAANTAANTAADHLDVLAMALLAMALLAMALLALPKPARGQPILVRADSAGATHAFIDELVGRKLWFSVGFDCDQRVRDAILALPEAAFTPARNDDGRPRRGAWSRSLRAWTLPLRAGPRASGRSAAASGPTPARPTRWPSPTPPATASRSLSPTSPTPQPDPAARPRSPTPQPDPDPAILEARHRPHAHVEDRIRAAKATGLRNLPLADFGANDAWLTLALIAQTLVCWAQALLLGAGAAAGRRLHTRRAQNPALPAVAYRRPDRPPRPPRHRPHRPRLAWAAVLVTALAGYEPCPPAADHTHPLLICCCGCLLAGLRPAHPAAWAAADTTTMPTWPGSITPSLTDLSVPRSRSTIQAHPNHTSQPRFHNPTASVKNRG